jgi:hypothetical protein
MGQANQVEGSGELRSYEYLGRIHAQRFKGQRLPFAREPYEAILRQVESFLVAQRLSVRIDDGPVAVATRASSSSRISYASAAAAAVALSLLATFLYQVLR